MRLLSLLTSEAERISAGSRPPRASDIPFDLINYRAKKDTLYEETLRNTVSIRKKKRKERLNTLSYQNFEISRSVTQTTITE